MQISLSRRGMVEFDASAFSTKEERDMLYAITKLDVSYNSLALVRGMQCLSNLTFLDISFNKVRSLTGLPLKLRKLVASHNELKYIDGLTPLAQLEFVDLSHNELVSISGLPGNACLHHVNVSHNRIGSLKGVELCTGIHELQASHNILRKVDDLVPLRFLRAVRSLNLTDNPVTSNPRNFAAIRLLVPAIQHLEGANAAAAAVATTNQSASLDASSMSAANLRKTTDGSAATRPRSPQQLQPGSRPITPNTSSIANASQSLATPRVQSPNQSYVGRPPSPTSANASRVPYHNVPPRDVGYAGRPQTPPSMASASQAHASSSSANRSAATQSTASLYQSLLKSLDPSTAFSRPTPQSSAFQRSASANDALQEGSPRNGLTYLSSRRDPSLPSKPTSQSHSKNGPKPIHDAADKERSFEDTSTAAIKVQRLQQERIDELERDLREARKAAEENRRDAENFRLQVKQLKETVERQAKVNAMLADANRQLSIETSRLQLGAPRLSASMASSIQEATEVASKSIAEAATTVDWVNGAGMVSTKRGSNAGLAPTVRRVSSITANESPEVLESTRRRSATPEGNPANRVSPTQRPPSPKTSAVLGAYTTAHRGSTVQATGKQSRRSDMSPKRGSSVADVRELQPQTIKPVFPPSVTPREDSLQALSVPKLSSPSRRNRSSTPKNVSFGGSQFYSPPQHYR